MSLNISDRRKAFELLIDAKARFCATLVPHQPIALNLPCPPLPYVLTPRCASASPRWRSHWAKRLITSCWKHWLKKRMRRSGSYQCSVRHISVTSRCKRVNRVLNGMKCALIWCSGCKLALITHQKPSRATFERRCFGPCRQRRL